MNSKITQACRLAAAPYKTHKVMRILSTVQVTRDLLFLDCGECWRLIKIDEMDETVVEVETGRLPVRYVQVVTLKGGSESYLICGMENRELLVFKLDLDNEDLEKRACNVQKLKTDYAVRSMTYEPKQQILVVGYFGEIVEVYAVHIVNA
jgi:hypothetical protein